MYEARVIVDSISPEGHRITSVHVVYPHAVHKDMLRHGLHRARSVASFRALKPEELAEYLRNGGAFRPEWATRVKGMGQGDALEDVALAQANAIWDEHVDDCLHTAERLNKLDIAKQATNFAQQDIAPLVEIITATEWDNYFALRLELKDDGTPVARPEVYLTALAIKEARDASTPTPIDHTRLHLPFIRDEELVELEQAYMAESWGSEGGAEAVKEAEHYWSLVSVGRCAMISFGRVDVEEDADMSFVRARDRLLAVGHAEPFEHVARPFTPDQWALIKHLQERTVEAGWPLDESIDEAWVIDIQRKLEFSSAFRGWRPMRKTIANEHDYRLLRGETVS